MQAAALRRVHCGVQRRVPCSAQWSEAQCAACMAVSSALCSAICGWSAMQRAFICAVQRKAVRSAVQCSAVCGFAWCAEEGAVHCTSGPCGAWVVVHQCSFVRAEHCLEPRSGQCSAPPCAKRRELECNAQCNVHYNVRYSAVCTAVRRAVFSALYHAVLRSSSACSVYNAVRLLPGLPLLPAGPRLPEPARNPPGGVPARGIALRRALRFSKALSGLHWLEPAWGGPMPDTTPLRMHVACVYMRKIQNSRNNNREMGARPERSKRCRERRAREARKHEQPAWKPRVRPGLGEFFAHN